ncbi:hypothetical protein ACF0H5_013557 [Mactra antiquata]
MLPYLYLVLLTPAVLTLELESNLLEEFRHECEKSIFKHLQDEYMMFLPMMIKHNMTMKVCKKMIWEQSECKSCVDISCPTYEYGPYPYHEKTTSVIDWNAWKEVGYSLFGENLDRFLSMAIGKYKPKFGHGVPLEKDIYDHPESSDKPKRRYRPRPSSNKPGNTMGNAMDMLDQMSVPFELGMNLLSGGFGDIFNGLTSGFNDVFSGVGNVLGDIGNGIGDTVGDIGNGVGNFFSGLFGRKRRSLLRPGLWKGRKEMEPMEPEALECMLQCEQCEQLHFGVNDETKNYVSSVCGEKIVEHTMYMREFMMTFSTLLKTNDPENGGIITKIEYDPDNFELSSLSYGDVYVTAMLPSGPVRYLSEYRLRLQSPKISVVEICEELVSKWGL